MYPTFAITGSPHFRVRNSRNHISPLESHRLHVTRPSFPPRRTWLAVQTESEPTAGERRKALDNKEPIPTNAGFSFSAQGFAERVAGEWFGYECDFSVRDGMPRNIPDRYVPDEYRDWGVEIKGFESLTSSICTDEDCLSLKRTRAMPSVGCEADAVVPEVAEKRYMSGEEGAVNGGFSDGSFSCGPSRMTGEHSQRWHVCLVDPNTENKSRARLEFGLVNEPFGAVTAFIEHWDGDFCNGEVLPGCGGKNQSFASDPALDVAAQLAGTWTVQSSEYVWTGNEWNVTERSSVVERGTKDAEEEVNVALPKGLSVGISTLDDGSKCVAAGWLTSNDLRIVCRRKYDSLGELTSVSRDTERRQS